MRSNESKASPLPEAFYIAHDDDRVVELVMNRLRSCLVLNECGDSFLKVPADLLQENRNVGTTKHYGGHDPNSMNSLRLRVRLASFNIEKVTAAAVPSAL